MSYARARYVAAGAVGLLVLVAGGAAAGAHPPGGSNSDAAHYLTRIDTVSPAVPGLTATVSPRGEWIEVINATRRTLIVLGYAHEPYLRISPSGVAENAASPTAVLNQNLFADISQALLTAPQPPNWQATSPANHARWHDHRIHWMGATRPPGVQAHPGTGQLIGRWTVHMTLDQQPVKMTGTLSWLPKKSGLDKSLLFLVGDALLLAAAAAAYAFYRRRRARHDPDPTTPSSTQPVAPETGGDSRDDVEGLDPVLLDRHRTNAGATTGTNNGHDKVPPRAGRAPRV